MRLKDKLIEVGYTWEEAEELLWQQAQDQADADRDRQLEEAQAQMTQAAQGETK